MPGRITGRIADWKGKFGWIEPDKPISHPEARLHKGQVYLSQTDVEAEISGIGAHVSFFVYADGTGLGAMNCRPSGSMPVQHTVTKPQMHTQTQRAPTARQAFAGTGGRQDQMQGSGGKKRISNSQIMGQVKVWKGSFGWIVPTEAVNHPLFRGQIYVKASDMVSQQQPVPGMAVSFYVYTDNQGLGAEQCTVVDESFAPPKREAKAVPARKPPAERAAPGPRERLTVVPTTGEVSDWKGSFGFIKPHEAVDHPEAAKRGGKIYVAQRDIVGGADLAVGQLVQFHVFADKSGLGADECMPF